jgi:ankyrin repeat protein
MFLKFGADLNAQNDLGGTPLHFAEFLIRNGADSTLSDRYGITPDIILEIHKHDITN